MHETPTPTRGRETIPALTAIWSFDEDHCDSSALDSRQSAGQPLSDAKSSEWLVLRPVRSLRSDEILAAHGQMLAGRTSPTTAAIAY